MSRPLDCPAPTQPRVTFDANGVASVDSAALLRSPRVREQYAAARRIVAAHTRPAATAFGPVLDFPPEEERP